MTYHKIPVRGLQNIKREGNKFSAVVYSRVFGEIEEDILVRRSLRLLKQAIRAHRYYHLEECFQPEVQPALARAYKREPCYR